MTNEDRLQVLEVEMKIAKAHISAVRAATLGLAFELCSCRPDIPERLARAMMDCDAPAIRETGGCELVAVETELLAEAIQSFAA